MLNVDGVPLPVVPVLVALRVARHFIGDADQREAEAVFRDAATAGAATSHRRELLAAQAATWLVLSGVPLLLIWPMGLLGDALGLNLAFVTAWTTAVPVAVVFITTVRYLLAGRVLAAPAPRRSQPRSWDVAGAALVVVALAAFSAA